MKVTWIVLLLALGSMAADTSLSIFKTFDNASWKHTTNQTFEPIPGDLATQINPGDSVHIRSRTTNNASAFVLDTDLEIARFHRLLDIRNKGQTKFAIDSDGRIGIGKTNIFQTMDIGITRVVDQGESAKAWINIAQNDTWPAWKVAGEWWVNTGIKDCIHELAWIDRSAGPEINQQIDRNIIQSTGEKDAQLYFSIQKNRRDLFRIQPAEASLIPYILNTEESLPAAMPMVQIGAGMLTVYGKGDLVSKSFIHLPGGNGPPQTPPPATFEGSVPVYVDTTTPALFIFINGAWKKL